MKTARQRLTLLLTVALSAILLLAATPSTRAQGRLNVDGTPKTGCVFFDGELAVNAPVKDEAGCRDEGPTERFAEQEGEIAPKVKTKRPPLAEEVGPPPGVQWKSTDPLPGLPFETSFDSEGWIDEGPGPTKHGDLNIVPDHPTAGCVTAVVPHPTNQNIIYIGTANGGVWKTTNALAAEPRWKALTDNQLSMSIGGLARDQNDAAGNTLVAGYGRRSSFGSNAGGAHKGLIRTTDGGTTWTRIGETALAGRSIYQIEVRGNTFLLAVPRADNPGTEGLYRTTDGGTNFTNRAGAAGSGLPAGACTHLARDPSNSTRYYAHMANTSIPPTGLGVYRSMDSGATWTSVSAGMPAANAAQVALTVAFDGTVFAAELTGVSRVYRSTNSGANWTPMDTVQANTSDTFNGFVAEPFAGGSNSRVYLSGLFTRCCFPFSGRVVRGDAALAAGSQWTSIASTKLQPGGTPCPPPAGCVSSASGGTAPHTDSRAMAFNIAGYLIECDDGGIYELRVADVGSEGDGANGNTWRSLNGNLHVNEMHSMAYDRVARIVIGGAQDTGFQEQLTSGDKLWDKTSNGDGGDAAIDFLAASPQAIRYGSSQNLGGFYRRTRNDHNVETGFTNPATNLDAGGGTPIIRGGPNNNMPFVAPVATNPVAGSRLIISGNANVYESIDQGQTVTQIDNFGSNQIAKIAYGGRFSGSNFNGVLFYGSGSNIRYRAALSGAVTGSIAFPGGTVQGIVFDPENWQTAFVIGNTIANASVYSANNIPANGAGAFTNITGNLTGVGMMHTIAYLTLPSGNAIVVGTDVGAYIMKTASPGVWKTLGNNLPHAPVYDSHFDAAGQVLTVSCFGRGAWLYDFKATKPTGQYGETFQSYVSGTTTFPARVGELYSNQLATTAQVIDNDMHELQLTLDSVGATRSVFRLPDLNPGTQVRGFSAKWNSQIYGDASTLGEGFSFNFGPLGGIPGPTLTGATYSQEDGFNAGLTVSVRTQSGNTPGYYVRVNGTTVPGGFLPKPSLDWGNFQLTRHFFEVDWRMDTGLTLRVDGVAIFTNLATPGFVPATGDRVVWGARTSGFDQETRLDNLVIFTNGVLSPVAGVAPYHFSSDFPQAGQTADKAFDGNPNTKWLTLDYTGFIGASFPAAKTVRAYTLISAEDVPGRDLAAWDFQTSNDGTLWTQHGAQSEQFFLNRGERRTFVVANPAAKTKFRVLISENHEAPEIQLAEFQPWELKTVPPVPAQVVSRKLHGGTPFDITLPLTGSPGIECRSGGAANDYQVIFTFPSAVTFTNAMITSGVGSVSGSSGSGTTTISINLTGVTNAQRLTATLLGASDGASTGDLSVQMGMLLGDVNGNASVNSTDISQTKLQSGQPVTNANFREDVNVSGSINATDVSSVKLKSGIAPPYRRRTCPFAWKSGSKRLELLFAIRPSGFGGFGLES